jgi:hypothetical protein
MLPRLCIRCCGELCHLFHLGKLSWDKQRSQALSMGTTVPTSVDAFESYLFSLQSASNSKLSKASQRVPHTKTSTATASDTCKA